MGAGTAGERGNSLSQLIVGMVSISSADHILRGPQYASNVVDRHPEPQEHGCAGMPQNMRCDFLAQPGQLTSRPPRPAFLGSNWPSGPLNYIALVPGTDFSRSALVSALGHLGEADEARRVWRELMEINPKYSFSEHLSRLPFKRKEDAQRLADGLAKAGLLN